MRAQIRLTDVGAIEDALDTLQHGTLASEGPSGPSLKNCVQLFRLLQLVSRRGCAQAEHGHACEYQGLLPCSNFPPLLRCPGCSYTSFKAAFGEVKISCCSPASRFMTQDGPTPVMLCLAVQMQAIEYLWHLRNAHVSLLERYQSATGIAERQVLAPSRRLLCCPQQPARSNCARV